METGSASVLVGGIVLLIAPVFASILWLRRRAHRSSWVRTEATISFVRNIKRRMSPTSTAETRPIAQAIYAFTDVSGREYTGESEILRKPTVGESVEVIYDSNNPSASELVPPHSLAVALLTRGAVFVILGALGVFLILLGLGAFSS